VEIFDEGGRILMRIALDAYNKQLSGAKAYAIERETSAPLIQEFFKTAELQRSKQLIKERVEKNQNELKIIKGKTIELDHDTYESVKEDVAPFLKSNHEHFKLRDTTNSSQSYNFIFGLLKNDYPTGVQISIRKPSISLT
jgi:hypothetical protein